MWLITFTRPGMLCVAAAALATLVFHLTGSLFQIQLRANRSSLTQDMVHIRHNDDVLDCASGVFLTLHKVTNNNDVIGGGDIPSEVCSGFLIRDDIILTSSDCSNSQFTFDFPGVGNLKAVPHNRLNKKDDRVPLDSRLGFLKANPPHHYHFLGETPVRRLRMFLSQNNNKSTTKNHERTSYVARCEGQKLIVHNFPVNGELVPIGHLTQILPKDILWEETDSNDSSTYMIQNNSDRWWTQTITLEEEENTIKNLFQKYEGPPGSVSIPGAKDHFKAKAANFFEVVDPRGGHRRGASCYSIYFNKWREEEPFSGQHFFDWLDFGPEKDLEISEKPRCEYESFTDKTVHYFDDSERREHEIYIMPSEDGTELLARYRINDQPVPESGTDSSGASEDGAELLESDIIDNQPVPENGPKSGHLYVWDLNKTFYIVDDTWDKARFGIMKHSGVMAGQPALSAGEIYFGKNGSIWGINYASGHYHPTIEATSMMHQWMKDDMGWNVTALHWIGREGDDGKEGWSPNSCDKIDWESNRIPGYNNSSALSQSCHEVTSSPTWILMSDD